jgi:hypothetical protein
MIVEHPMPTTRRKPFNYGDTILGGVRIKNTPHDGVYETSTLHGGDPLLDGCYHRVTFVPSDATRKRHEVLERRPDAKTLFVAFGNPTVTGKPWKAKVIDNPQELPGNVVKMSIDKLAELHGLGPARSKVGGIWVLRPKGWKP